MHHPIPPSGAKNSHFQIPQLMLATFTLGSNPFSKKSTFIRDALPEDTDQKFREEGNPGDPVLITVFFRFFYYFSHDLLRISTSSAGAAGKDTCLRTNGLETMFGGKESSDVLFSFLCQNEGILEE